MLNRWCCIVLLMLLLAIPFAACASAEDEAEGTAVLMNIPYGEFYTSKGVVDAGLDAVSSATHNKPRTMGLAGGSYHVNADGSDITGVTYPVYVQSLADLEALGGREITEESSVEIDDVAIILFCEKDSAAYAYLSGKSNILWRSTDVAY